MGEKTDEDAQGELEGARDALHDARVLFDGEGTESGVINRLYYAAFHAAQATLYVRGMNPSSHGHVRRQFGQHVVLAGDASREDGRLLGILYDYRREADYGGGAPDMDVERLVAEVDEFVEHMSNLVGEE